MNEFLLIKFLHVVGLAYWLGGDLGVFYSSYFVADEKRPAEVRIAAAKILFALDQAPRICMTMMLPLGIHLAWRLGIFDFGAPVMGLVWLVCFGWLGMVVYLHFGSGAATKQRLVPIDYWFRVLAVVALVALGVGGLIGQLRLPYWAALKLLIFGGLIACGLMVRIRLREFGPAFANLAAGNAGPEDNAAIARSLGGTRPFVITIWIGLLASSALGLHLL